MKSLSLALGFALLFCSSSLLAQHGSSGSSGGSGGSRGTGGGVSIGNTPSTTQPNVNLPPLPSTAPMLFMSGKVLIDDGTALTDQAAIQTSCSGTTRTVGYTDKKGAFSLQLDPNSSAGMTGIGDVTDTASPVPGQRGNWQSRDWRNCQVQVLLAGYVSQVVEMSPHMNGDSRVELGNISLHRIATVQGLTISATTAAAPSKARKEYEKGLGFEKKKDWSRAQEKFQAAVDAYPRYAVAWAELSRVQFLQSQSEDAKKSLRKAIEADSRFVPAYQGLAGIAAKEQNWKELAEVTDQSLRLNPVNFPQDWLMNAAAYYYLQNYDAAEKSARHGLDVDLQHRVPRLEYVLGLALAQKHDSHGAIEHLRNYVRLAPKAADVEVAQNQINELEAQEAAAQQAPEQK